MTALKGEHYARCCGKFKSYIEMDEEDPTQCKDCVNNGLENLRQNSKIFIMQEEEYNEAQYQEIRQCIL
jgi:hypothetical protein